MEPESWKSKEEPKQELHPVADDSSTVTSTSDDLEKLYKAFDEYAIE